MSREVFIRSYIRSTGDDEADLSRCLPTSAEPELLSRTSHNHLRDSVQRRSSRGRVDAYPRDSRCTRGMTGG
jgi:hypothetical protein